MIEVIYKDEKQEMKDGTTEWELPKNIRQIGLVSGDYRIYIEDYVYTFLHRAAQTKGRDEENGSCLAILLGEARWRSGNGVVFIRGALLTEGEEISEEHIEITQNMWQTIHEEQEKYFEGQEIVGWFLACQSLSMEASELIQKVHEIDGIKRIRLGSLEPRIITEEFASSIAALPKMCPHFHLSLQSGCNATLKRMNRRYSAEEYMEKCDLLRKYFHNPALTTDVIVGFPGETDEEFQETVDYLTKLNLYEMHIFKFSPRQGTVAAGMRDQIGPEIKNQRSDVLLALSEKNKHAYEASFRGETLEVLIEEKVRRNGKDGYRGHTERYLDIFVEEECMHRICGREVDIINHIVQIPYGME